MYLKGVVFTKTVFGKVSNVFWSANVKLVLYH